MFYGSQLLKEYIIIVHVTVSIIWIVSYNPWQINTFDRERITQNKL